jgi:hypothetical protein
MNECYNAPPLSLSLILFLSLHDVHRRVMHFIIVCSSMDNITSSASLAESSMANLFHVSSRHNPNQIFFTALHLKKGDLHVHRVVDTLFIMYPVLFSVF